MRNLDLREILKNVPKGTILYSTTHGNVCFEWVDLNSKLYPICCHDIHGTGLGFTKEGKYHYNYDGECVLFPSKENRDWNTFCPFKDGDILYVKTTNTEFIFIYKDNDLYNINDHVACSKSGTLYHEPSCSLCDKRDILNIRLATEEEKEKLFDVIKENGYKWTAETKTLEKLIAPKFKIGDKICKKGDKQGWVKIATITDTCYIDEYRVFNIPIEKQDEWELYTDKFDITTLKPYDKVLVRFNDSSVWEPQLFSYLDINLKHNSYKFVIVGLCSISHCIPYKGNEHLIGTTNDCNEYYKTW